MEPIDTVDPRRIACRHTLLVNRPANWKDAAPTWRWSYSREFADALFDCVAVLQAVQHNGDWRETGKELLRVMKPGRGIVLAEIAYSPETQMKIGLDLHIEYVFERLLSRVGWTLEEFPYFTPTDLTQAFSGLVANPGTFVWKGVEIFLGHQAVETIT